MRTFLWSAFAFAAMACGGGGASTTTSSRPVRGSADLITEAEINAGVYQNALEIIQNLRPNMARPRAMAATAAPVPVVPYMDGVRLQDLSALATIPASRVKEIRYINANDATTRYGTGHSSGVILVTTKLTR